MRAFFDRLRRSDAENQARSSENEPRKEISFHHLYDTIDLHGVSRNLSVPFLRTQETVARMILVAIIGSVFVFAIPFPAGYLGLLLGIFFTQNAMGLAVMNTLGTLFGGFLATYLTVIMFAFIPYEVHWSLYFLYYILWVVVVGWTNYNPVGKKIFLLMIVISCDQNVKYWAAVNNATLYNISAPSASNSTHAIVQIGVNYSLSSLLAAGLILLGATFPWIRFSRSELENELKLTIQIMASTLSLLNMRVLTQNENNKHEFEKHTAVLVSKDLLDEIERQQLKAYQRIAFQMGWETVHSLTYYTSVYYKVNCILSATRQIHYWVSKITDDQQFHLQFLKHSNKCFTVVQGQMESLTHRLFNPSAPTDVSVMTAEKNEKRFKKFSAFLLKFEAELNPVSVNVSVFFNGTAQLYFGYGLIEIYQSILQLEQLQTDHRLSKEGQIKEFANALWEKLRDWFYAVYWDVVPWTRDKGIIDYLTSSGAKKRIMLWFGLIFTQTVCGIVLFHPVTRAISGQTVWFPLMSLLTFGSHTTNAILKGRARLLGTTVGVALGYIYFLVGLYNPFFLTSMLCLLIAVSGFFSIENEEFFRLTLASFVVITYGVTVANLRSDQIVSYSLYRFFWVTLGVLINLLWFMVFFFHSTRQDWTNAIEAVLMHLQAITKRSYEQLIVLDVDFGEQMQPLDTGEKRDSNPSEHPLDEAKEGAPVKSVNSDPNDIEMRPLSSLATTTTATNTSSATTTGASNGDLSNGHGIGVLTLSSPQSREPSPSVPTKHVHHKHHHHHHKQPSEVVSLESGKDSNPQLVSKKAKHKHHDKTKKSPIEQPVNEKEVKGKELREFGEQREQEGEDEEAFVESEDEEESELESHRTVRESENHNTADQRGSKTGKSRDKRRTSDSGKAREKRAGDSIEKFLGIHGDDGNPMKVDRAGGTRASMLQQRDSSDEEEEQEAEEIQNFVAELTSFLRRGGKQGARKKEHTHRHSIDLQGSTQRMSAFMRQLQEGLMSTNNNSNSSSTSASSSTSKEPRRTELRREIDQMPLPVPEEEVLHNIYSAHHFEALDGPIRQLDTKFKNFALATLQLYEEPRLWEPPKFDVTHLESLIVTIRWLANAVVWFAKYSHLAVRNKENWSIQCQRIFQKNYLKLQRSLDAMRHVFANRNNHLASIRFMDLKSLAHDKSARRILGDMLSERKWSTALTTTIVVYKTLNMRLYEAWELVFDIMMFSKLKMMDNSANIY